MKRDLGVRGRLAKRNLEFECTGTIGQVAVERGRQSRRLRDCPNSFGLGRPDFDHSNTALAHQCGQLRDQNPVVIKPFRPGKQRAGRLMIAHISP